MRRRFRIAQPFLGLWIVLLLTLGTVLDAPAATVTETATEFLAGSDVNGDGRVDAVVVDKITGNVRVGYQAASGALTWGNPVPTGASHVGSAALGAFLQTDREALVVTSSEFNRIQLLDLTTPGGGGTAPRVIHPPHPGLTLLVALDNPTGTGGPAQPDWLTTGAHDPGITILDLLTYSIADAQARFQDQLVATGSLRHGAAFQRSPTDTTLVAAMQTGSNDTFVAYSYENPNGPVLTRSNLAANTEFVSIRFYNQPLAQLLFYVPGQSNVILQPLVNGVAGIQFGSATVTTFQTSVEQVYAIDEGSNGVAVVRFGDGTVSGLRPPVGGGTLRVTYGLGLGASGNVVSGVIPLGAGRLALLSGPSNTLSSAQAQIFTKNNTGYVQTATSPLSALSTAATRANVWLFSTEPFVQRQPDFIASLNGGDWTTALTGLPGTVRVRAERDQGLTAGLGNAVTNNLGAAPGGTVYGLANQYHPAISLFSASAPRAADPSRVTIAPTPGAYSAAIDVTLTKANPLDSAYYRLNGAGDWTEYLAPIRISNNVTVAFFGQTSSGQRGAIQQATYTIAGSVLPPTLDLSGDSNGTNGTPAGTNGGPVYLSTLGTVFYGRQSGTTGSVWAIHLDGTSDRFVTTGTRPRVSPDGHWLAFTREGSPFLSLGNLWLRDLTTGDERRLFTNPNFIVHYDWLNDSSGLVFDLECTVQLIDLQGNVSDLPMVNDCFDDAPVVNPFDGRLAFHNLNAVPQRGIYVADAGGTSRQRLPINLAGPAWPEWSPEGSRLAVADVRAGTGFGQNLFTIRADGSGLSQLTGFTDATNGFPFGALWTPQGDALIGAGTIRGVNGLWILPLNAAGTECAGLPIRLPTTIGDLIDIAGSVRIGSAPPILHIRRQGGFVIVSWDRNVRDYVLQAAPEASRESAWLRVTDPVTLNGGFNEVRLAESALAGMEFFRLVRP